jgi:hypothetical protein
LIFNNIFLYNDNLYKKIDKYKISYEFIDSIDSLYKNFHEKICLFFVNFLPCHFKNYDFYSLMSNYIINSENLLKTLNLITTNKITLNFNLLEFNDGIYFIKLNKFLPKELIKQKEIRQLATMKFYNKTFKHLKKPTE